MKRSRSLLWAALAAGTLLVILGVVELAYLVAVAAAVLIWRLGFASFTSLRSDPEFVPSGPPEPVDLEVERVVYGCEGCGAEVLLLMRGTPLPPRHCGERMIEQSSEFAPDER